MEPVAIEIRPNAYYVHEDVRELLGIGDATLKEACENGELRFTKKGRSRLYRGQWLIDWLEPTSNKNG